MCAQGDACAINGVASAQIDIVGTAGIGNTKSITQGTGIFKCQPFPTNQAVYLVGISFGATKADTNEIYGLIGWKWLTLKYSRALGDTFGVSNASGTNYIDLSGSYTIDSAGVTLGAHYGKQTYKGTTADALKAVGADPTYSDYKLSVSKDFSGYAIGLAYSSTNAKKGVGQFYNVGMADGSNIDLGKGTAVLSITHSF